MMHLLVSLLSDCSCAQCLVVNHSQSAFRVGRNAGACSASRASRRSVQSQSPQAQGSVPFSSRQLARAWASWTFTRSKNSSQYGRSSSSGTLQ